MGTLFLTEEARIYSGAKIASSTNGAGKTGQLHVRDVTFLMEQFVFTFWNFCKGNTLKKCKSSKPSAKHQNMKSRVRYTCGVSKARVWFLALSLALGHQGSSVSPGCISISGRGVVTHVGGLFWGLTVKRQLITPSSCYLNLVRWPEFQDSSQLLRVGEKVATAPLSMVLEKRYKKCGQPTG